MGFWLFLTQPALVLASLPCVSQVRWKLPPEQHRMLRPGDWQLGGGDLHGNPALRRGGVRPAGEVRRLHSSTSAKRGRGGVRGLRKGPVLTGEVCDRDPPDLPSPKILLHQPPRVDSVRCLRPSFPVLTRRGARLRDLYLDLVLISTFNKSRAIGDSPFITLHAWLSLMWDPAP